MSNHDWLRSYGLVLPLGLIVPWLPRECAHHSNGGGSGGAPGGCTGNCPVRVDPNAASNGTGQSWQEPKNDVQAALDEQAAKGGGEVWVLGGEFAALQTAGATLLRIPSHVTLRGGFLGNEATPAQRTATAPATVLRNVAATGTSAKLIEIAQQNDIALDGLRLVDGSPPFSIDATQAVRVNDVVVEGSHSEATISGSDVRFERVTLDVQSAAYARPLNVADSDVAIVSSVVRSYFGSVSLQRSRLLVQSTAFGASLGGDVDSVTLILDSSLTEAGERSGVAVLAGASALVGSSVTEGGARSAVNAGSLLVFNSSFVDVNSVSAGGNHPRAAVIDATSLRVSASTFYDYSCEEGPQPCNFAIVHGDVDNTLFVREFPDISEGQPYTPDQFAMQNGNLPPGNCVSFDLEAFSVVDTGDALAVEHPCADGGESVELEASRQQVLAFAAPFLVAPFNADLSRYASPDWWRSETVRVDRSPDTGAPDPGKHVKISSP